MKIKHSTIRLITFLIMLSLWCTGSVSVGAAKAKPPVCAKKLVINTLKNNPEDPVDSEYNGGYICIGNLTQDAKISNVRSSNSSIAAASMLEEHGFHAIHVFPKNGKVKSGTKSTITFKVKQNKKTYTLKCKVTLKYASPFQSLKLGNKDYSNTKSVQNEVSDGFEGIKLKAVAGYKIAAVEVIGKMSFVEDEDGNLWPSSYAYRFADSQINTLKNRYFSNVRKVVIYYKATKKPTYYKKPKNWCGESESPLYGKKTIIFE